MDQNQKAQLIQLAEHYLQNNDFILARDILSRVIAADPHHSRSNELLAYIAGNAGDHRQALMYLQTACQADDSSREALYHLGNMYLAQGEFEQAIHFLRAALLKSQPFFEAAHNLGLAFANLEQHLEAVEYFSQALQLNPQSFEALSNLGNSYKNLGQPENALPHQEKALEIAPQNPQCWVNLGVTLNELKQYQKALEAFDQAIQLQENYGEAWSNKGIVLKALGLYEDALKAQDIALGMNPQDAHAWSNKSVIYLALLRHQEALHACEQAITLQPHFAEAFYNQGIVFQELKQPAHAIQSLTQAIKINPDYQDAWVHLGNVYFSNKSYQEALLAYQTVLEINPDYPFLFGMMLHTKQQMCHWKDFDRDIQTLNAQAQLGAKISPPFQFITLNDDEVLQLQVATTWLQDKYPSKPVSSPLQMGSSNKIRIGYFSADFHNHATAYLMAEFFELHNKEKFEIYAFSYGPKINDEMRNRLIASFDRFIEVPELTDQLIAEQSRALKIDIAIDLKGYTQDGRPGIFSFRAAPIQINYLGYPGTIGSKHMDYIVADPLLIPEESQAFFSEKIIYLPNSYQPNDSKRKISDMPVTRAQMNLPEDAFVFCCFNNSYKITPEIFGAWMRILKSVPNSVLWLLKDNSWATENIFNEALAKEISPERIIFAERVNSVEHLGRQRLADLFLDTAPCNAHTTASDALWAGLPLLTLKTHCFAGRVASSLLKALELPELITSSLEDYERLAIQLAIEPNLLKSIEENLEKNRLTTPLFNTSLFTKNLEFAYTKIYQRYQAGLAPDHLIAE